MKFSYFMMAKKLNFMKMTNIATSRQVVASRKSHSVPASSAFAQTAW